MFHFQAGAGGRADALASGVVDHESHRMNGCSYTRNHVFSSFC